MNTLIFVYRSGYCWTFCEDSKRVVINARHELILIRARNGNNCIVRVMSHVALNEVNKLSMLCALESGRYLSMSLHSCDLYEYPLLSSTTKHSWANKTQLKKPRYVIFGLQTDKKNIMTAHKIYFDSCKLTNVNFI